MGLFTKSKKVTQKSSEVNLDEFDFNDVSPDMSDQASPDIKNIRSRNPVVKALKATGSGFASEATSARFIREKVLKALPKEAAYTAKAIDDTAAGIRDIYAASVKELRPQVKSITKKIDRLVPANAKALKKMSQGISKFFNGEEFDTSSYSKEEAENNQITGSLASIFNIQQAHTEAINANDRAREETRAQIKDSIETKRFGASMDVSIGMANNIARLTTYNEGPNQAFQKKLLELQYRQLFVAVDTFKNQEKYNEIFRIGNEAIVKNTSLPDFVKLRTTERFRSSAANQLFESSTEYITNGFKKLGKKVMAKVSEAKDGLEMISSLMDGIQMSRDMDQQMAEMDGGKTDASFTAIMMKMLGAYAANKIGDFAAEEGQEQLSKREKVMSGLQKFLMAGQDPRDAVKKFFREAKIPISEKSVKDILSDDSEVGIIKRMLQAAEMAAKVFDETTIDTSLITRGTKIKDLNAPAIFDTRTYRTINDIIPGYLSRMTFELQYLNDSKSGDSILKTKKLEQARGTDHTIFDFSADSFTTKGKLSDKLESTFMKYKEEGYKITSEALEKIRKNYISNSNYDELTPEDQGLLNADIANSMLFNQEGDSPEGWLAYINKNASDVTKRVLAPMLASNDLFGGKDGKYTADQHRARVLHRDLSRAAKDRSMYMNNIINVQDMIDIYGEGIVRDAAKGIVGGEAGNVRFDAHHAQRSVITDLTGDANYMKSSIRQINPEEDKINAAIDAEAEFITKNLLKNETYTELGVAKQNKVGMALSQLRGTPIQTEIKDKVLSLLMPLGTMAQKKQFLNNVKSVDNFRWNKQLIIDEVARAEASDINIKTNIHTLSSPSGQKALSTVNQMTGLAYTFKPGNGKDPNKTYFGSSAQDMYKAGGSTLAPGGKSVDMLSAVGLNQEAIRQVDAKVQALQSGSGGNAYNETIALNTARTNKLLAIIAGQGRITSAASAISLNRHGIELPNSGKFVDVLKDTAGNVIDLALITGKSVVGGVVSTLKIGNNYIVQPLYENILKLKDPTIALAKTAYSGARAGLNTVWDIGHDIVTNKVPTALGWMQDKLIQGKDKVMGAFRFTSDYVTENGKTLYAELLKAGAYFREDTGEVIKKLSDLKGNIVDKTGKLVMSVSDYGQGLFDNKGNKVKLYGSWLYSKAKEGIGKAWEIGNNIGKHAYDFASNTMQGKNFLGKAIRVAGNTIRGALGGLGIHLGQGTSERASYNVLLDIRDLLREGNKDIKMRSDVDEEELLKKEAGQASMKDEVMSTISNEWENKNETLNKFKEDAKAKAEEYKNKGLAAAKKYLEGDSYLAGKAQALQGYYGTAKDKVMHALGMTEEQKHYRNFVGPMPEMVGPAAPKYEWKTKGLIGGWLNKLNPFSKKEQEAETITKSFVGKDKSGTAGIFKLVKKGNVSKWYFTPKGDTSSQTDKPTIESFPTRDKKTGDYGVYHAITRNGIKTYRHTNTKDVNAAKDKGLLSRINQQVLDAVTQEIDAEKAKAVQDAQKGKPSLLTRFMNRITGGIFSKKKGQVDNDKNDDGKRDGNVDDETKRKFSIRLGWLSKLNPFSKKETEKAKAAGEDISSLGMFGLIGGALKLVGVFASLATTVGGTLWVFDKLRSLFGGGNNSSKRTPGGKQGDVYNPNGSNESGSDSGSIFSPGNLLGGAAALYAGKKLGIGKALKWAGSKLALGRGAAGAASMAFPVLEGATALTRGAKIASMARTAMTVGKVGLIGADMLLTGGIGTLAATTIGGLISAPVLLSALAVAAIGTAAYFTYKWAKSDGILYKIRNAQYGFTENGQDNVYFSRLEKLEDYLQEKNFVVKGSEGWQIAPGINTEELLKLMNVDMTSDLEQNNFAKWFHYRFKPFYLNFLTALSNRNLKTPDDVYKLDDLTLKSFMMDITMPNGPYDFAISPFITKPNCTDTKAYTKELIEFATNELLKKKALSKFEITNYFDLNKKTKSLERKLAAQAIAKQEEQSTQAEMKKKVEAALMPNIKRNLAREAYDLKYGTNSEDEGDDLGNIPSGIIDPDSVFKKASVDLVRASGKIRDAKGDMTWVKLTNSNVDMSGLNPQVKKQFLAMCQEYGELTGKYVHVNSAYRSPAANSAAGGALGSMHRFGFAIDIASEDANALEKLGLMRKYGFTRPIGQEPWHIEPAGIQSMIQQIPKLTTTDPGQIDAQVIASIGRGGGGLGTLGKDGIRKLSRDAALAAKFFNQGGREIDPSEVSMANRWRSAITGTKMITNAATIMSSLDDEKAKLAEQAGIGADGKPIVADGKISAGLRPHEEAELRSTSSKYTDMKAKISGLAKELSMDEDESLVTAYRESRFGARTGGSKGLMQIMPDTLNGLVKNYRAEIKAKGFDPDKLDVNDFKTNMYLTSLLNREAGEGYKKLTGADATPEMKYIMHLLGAGSSEGKSLLRAIKEGKLNWSIKDIFGDMSKAIEKNPQELLLPDGSIPTVGQLLEHQKNRYRSILSGIKGGNASVMPTALTPAPGIGTPISGGTATSANDPSIKTGSTNVFQWKQSSIHDNDDTSSEVTPPSTTKVSTPAITEAVVNNTSSGKVTNIDDFNKKVSAANRAIITKTEENSLTPGLIKTSTGVAKTNISQLDNASTPMHVMQASHAIHVESLDVEKQMLKALLTLVSTMSPKALSELKKDIAKQEEAPKPLPSSKNVGDRTPISMRRQLQA